MNFNGFFLQKIEKFDWQCIFDFIYKRQFFSISKDSGNPKNRNDIWIDFLILKEIWFLGNLLMEEESLIALNPPYVDGLVVGRLKLATI